MDQKELNEIHRQHQQIWHRFRRAETEEEGMAIMNELFTLWPYNRNKKETETNS